jgi:Co/Zn/Cd efflux system component
MTRTRKKEIKKAVLSSAADLCNGMAAAWAFASFDALFHFAWLDLISSFFLAILSFSLSVGIKLKTKTYDKHT